MGSPSSSWPGSVARYTDAFSRFTSAILAWVCGVCGGVSEQWLCCRWVWVCEWVWVGQTELLAERTDPEPQSTMMLQQELLWTGTDWHKDCYTQYFENAACASANQLLPAPCILCIIINAINPHTSRVRYPSFSINARKPYRLGKKSKLHNPASLHHTPINSKYLRGVSLQIRHHITFLQWSKWSLHSALQLEQK